MSTEEHPWLPPDSQPLPVAPPTGESANGATPPPSTNLNTLLKNPIALAAGGLLAGVILAKFLQRDSIIRAANRFARDVSKNSGGGKSSFTDDMVKSLVQKALPSMEQTAKKLLADILKPKD